MLLQLRQARAEHPRVRHVAEDSAAALLPYRARSDRVALCPLELVGRHRLLAQLLELGEESRPGNILLLGGGGDVRHKGPRQLMLAVERVHCVRERLTVPQLVEETAAEAAGDACDYAGSKSIGIGARGTGKCYRERSLCLVA